MSQHLDIQNSEYWNDLCGSRAARKLRIKAGDPTSVTTFDNWFFYFYPYLRKSTFIPWDNLARLSVLEVGLGYGSVTRRLCQSGALVTAADIAPAPVHFIRHTAPGTSQVQASALNLPLPNDTMDIVVSIGCLHHTGNVEAAIRECVRVLKPGGLLVLMIYNRFSYKRWLVAPISTGRDAWTEKIGKGRREGRATSRRVGWFWDRNPAGDAPPHTEFMSVRQIRDVLTEMQEVSTTVTNVDNITDLLPGFLQHLVFDKLRIRLLKTPLSRVLGLDVYVTATK